MPVFVLYLMKSKELKLDWQELLGFVGGALTTAAFVPQAWRLFKLRSAREISLAFTALLLLGIACWLSYGIFLGLTPLIVWNSITLAFTLVMLYAKLKYGK